MIEVNDTPDFEDYFNFCGFSHDDYKYFLAHLTPITPASPNFDTARLWLNEEELAERDRTAAAIKQQDAERAERAEQQMRLNELTANERTQLGDTWQPAAAAIVAEVFAGLGERLERAGLIVSLFDRYFTRRRDLQLQRAGI